MPSATVGLQARRPDHRRTAQAARVHPPVSSANHLGDRNGRPCTASTSSSATSYHLNAEEEPELPNYSPAADFPRFRSVSAHVGALHCWATVEVDPTENPRFGARRLRAVLEDLLAIAPVARKAAVQNRLDLLQLAVARAFTNPADAAEASVPDRQGIGSARLATR